MKIKRFLWRSAYWLRFQLFQRRRLDRVVLEWVVQRPFLILPQVFNPTLFLTSEFMVTTFNEHLISPGAKVLDMGTGSGVGAVFAAQWAREVIAVDVNETAVRCARINAQLNQVETIVQVRAGDLFAPVANERFDVILFNPPYFVGKPQNLLDHAFRATTVIERFAANLKAHLCPNGRLLLLLSSVADEAAILALFTKQGFQNEVAAQKHLGSEVVTLYQLTHG
jgi:release factor glutamine methyltransferase